VRPFVASFRVRPSATMREENELECRAIPRRRCWLPPMDGCPPIRVGVELLPETNREQSQASSSRLPRDHWDAGERWSLDR
jgi:hypothetical protein